ncbi:MAG: nucleoside-diphosphate kinase [Candidatus Omnitrophica bacterium]|nr:nucleoside-diphosphate kinase [Candidatus Omnitrophota bacterium]
MSTRNKKIENVLVLIKPDGISRGLMGHVMARFSQTGLNLIAVKFLKVSRQLAQEHYRHIRGTPFYDQVIEYLVGKFHKQKNVLVLIYRGEKAIAVARELAGATNPEEAHPTSIRGSFGRITTSGIFENVIHVSSDPKEAEREIKLWFEPQEIDGELYPTQEKILKSIQKYIWV